MKGIGGPPLELELSRTPDCLHMQVCPHTYSLIRQRRGAYQLECPEYLRTYSVDEKPENEA